MSLSNESCRIYPISTKVYGGAQVRDRLEVIERKGFRVLYQSKADGSYWRLDEASKAHVRFLIKLVSPKSWAEFDATDMEKRLLIESRGWYSDDVCRSECELSCIKESAFCEHHTYEMGVRK